MASLLWIVKTADSASLSHSENTERRQVFSQAQRTSRRKRTAKRQKVLSGQPPSREVTDLEGPGYSDSNDCRSDPRINKPGSIQGSSLPRSHDVSGQDSEKALSLPFRWEQEVTTGASSYKSPTTTWHSNGSSPFGSVSATTSRYGNPTSPIYRDGLGLRINPFSDLAVRNSQFVWRIIDYFTRVVLPSQNFFDYLFNVSSTYGRFPFQPLFHEDFHYAGVLAFYSSLSQLQQPDSHTTENVTRYTIKALAKHRGRLQELDGRADELAVHTALSFALLAEATEDSASFTVHHNSIKLLLGSAGGFSNLSPNSHIRKILPHWEAFWTLGHDINPVFKNTSNEYVPNYPAYPFTTEVGNIMAQLPPGFQRLAEQSLLAFDVLELLARVVNHTANDVPSLGVSFDNMPPLTSVSRRFNSYWESSPCLSHPSTIYGEENLGRWIVLGVVLYCCQTYLPQRVPIMIYRAARRRLTADLMQMSAYDLNHQDVMLWVRMNVIDAWQTFDQRLSPQGVDLLRNMRSAFPGIGSTAQLQIKLKRFLWNEAFGTRCARYWRSSRSMGKASSQ